MICYWMDGNKNRVDFIIPVTRNQAVWFDARTGHGTSQVNPLPARSANGFDNPFLPGGAGNLPRVRWCHAGPPTPARSSR